MSRVIVAVSNDLVTDQRVHRSCSALLEAGHSVCLVGRLLPASSPLARPYRTVRLRLLFHRSAFFYAEFNIRLFFFFLFSRADVFFANDTDTLLAASLAALLRRKALFFDAHELFPEVPELVHRPRIRRFWQSIEDLILPRIGSASLPGACCTVCQSIADFYRSRYGLSMAVVRNVPLPSLPSPLYRRPSKPFTILYQGAVNVGRGIEWMIDAMAFLPHCRFVVAGVGDLFNTLRRYAASKPYAQRIVFLGRLAPDQLHQLTLSADLGLVLLQNLGLNYYYSLPNRIGDFAHASVPVLASAFPEISRIVDTYHIGSCLPDNPSPRQIAQAVLQLFDDFASLDAAVIQRRFAAAQSDLSWSNDKNVFLRHFHTIL